MALALLAAGRSSRMATAHKLLLPFPDDPIVRRSAEAALSSGCGPLGVVVSDPAGAVAEALAGLPLTLLENRAATRGIATSIRRAAEWGFTVGDALVLLLADEPEVRPDVIRRAADLWRDERPAAIRTAYRDRPGHPVLVTKPFLQDAEGPAGDRGLGARLDGPDVVRLDVDREAPTDIDTVSDYRRALARLTH